MVEEPCNNASPFDDPEQVNKVLYRPGERVIITRLPGTPTLMTSGIASDTPWDVSFVGSWRSIASSDLSARTTRQAESGAELLGPSDLRL